MKTNYQEKTLDPVWNEKLILPGVTDPSLSLEIEVEDWDAAVNEFMGKVILPLYTFEDKRPVKKTYKLNNKQGNADGVNRGEIDLLICWRFNPDVKAKEKDNGPLGLGLLKRDDDDDSEPEEDGVVLTLHSFCSHGVRNLRKILRSSMKLNRRNLLKKKKR